MFHALGHCAGRLIEVVPGAISVILALDHMTVLVIPDPLAARRDIHVLVHSKGTVFIKPVPRITCRIVYLFGDSFHTIVIPVMLTAFRYPTICSRLIFAIACMNSCIPDDSLRHRISNGYHCSMTIRNAASINVGRGNTASTMPSAGQTRRLRNESAGSSISLTIRIVLELIGIEEVLPVVIRQGRTFITGHDIIVHQTPCLRIPNLRQIADGINLIGDTILLDAEVVHTVLFEQ